LPRDHTGKENDMADEHPKRGKQDPKPSEDGELPPGRRVTTEARGDDPGRRITDWPSEPLRVAQSGGIDVNLNGTPIGTTSAQALWELIFRATDAISFREYDAFITRVLCVEDHGDLARHKKLPDMIRNATYFGVETYQILRAATEAFLIGNCGFLDTGLDDLDPAADPNRFGGTVPDLPALLGQYLGTSNNLPYIDRIIGSLPVREGGSPFCGMIAQNRPCFLELMWSYWHEEGMVVQAINTLSLRFQNKRGPAERDPLANLETHPLRPLANLLWGYIQDEDHRLTIARRAYEYEHHYGLTLVGKAVPRLRPADRRSKFLEAFHRLLREAAIFYDRAANLTIRADGFPLLNMLREVHLLLAEGAHNQFRDLPWTARAEMLIQQWLLSRREVLEFLGGRAAVPYTEDWMGPVDSLKRLMGWSDTPVTHFHDLAVTGERILLSIRYHAWNDANTEAEATGWAQYFKPEIQRYIHAYQAVTGVDLGAIKDSQPSRQVNATLPSVLLQQRTARQGGR